MLNNKKKVLGRGIGALIGDVGERAPLGGSTTQAVEKGKEKFLLCPIDEIAPNENQPRKKFDEAALKELSDSIREKGIIEPIVVRRHMGSFEIIAGERRWRASRMAGLKEVPVVILEADDRECLELAIIENIQREELNAIEEAEAYRSLMDFGLSQEEVARKVGKERATVANYVRLLKLSPEVKTEIVKGSITMGHARAILALEAHSAQNELCREIITKGLSVREAETLASQGGAKSPRLPKKSVSVQNPLEDELRGIFGTKVSLKDRKGKGKIEISYFSADERERLIDLMRSIQQGF